MGCELDTKCAYLTYRNYSTDFKYHHRPSRYFFERDFSFQSVRQLCLYIFFLSFKVFHHMDQKLAVNDISVFNACCWHVTRKTDALCPMYYFISFEVLNNMEQKLAVSVFAPIPQYIFFFSFEVLNHIEQYFFVREFSF